MRGVETDIDGLMFSVTSTDPRAEEEGKPYLLYFLYIASF